MEIFGGVVMILLGVGSAAVGIEMMREADAFPFFCGFMCVMLSVVMFVVGVSLFI